MFALDPDIDSRVNFRRSSDDVLGPQGSTQDVDNAAIELEYALGAHTLTAVLGYSAYEYELQNDTDFLPVPMTQQRVNEDFDQTSVEVRLASNLGGRFDYLAGLYWQKNDLSMVGATAVNFEYLGPIAPLPDGLVTISSFNSGVDYGLETETASIFAQGTWRFTETARINLGALRRRVQDRRSLRLLSAPGRQRIGSGVHLGRARKRLRALSLARQFQGQA